MSTSKNEIKGRIDELRRLIEKANRDYYDLAQPTVGDRDYDLWEAELLKLEDENPEFKSAASPVRQVAGGVTEGFAKVTHNPPMQSLDKTHAKGELAEFDAFVRNQLNLHSSPPPSPPPPPHPFTSSRSLSTARARGGIPSTANTRNIPTCLRVRLTRPAATSRC